jgi:hypothetical protein
LILTQKSTIFCADLTCAPNPDPSICSSFQLTPVTIVNEVINVLNKPNPFTDPWTTEILLRSPSIANQVPNGLLTIFPNLKKLTMENIFLRALPTNSFPSCAQINWMNFTKNNFPKIFANFAPSCTSLGVLCLNANNIQIVDSAAFTGLTALRVLMLEDNYISCISENTFTMLSSLVSLFLKGNRLTVINSQTFANLPKLMNIFLHDNCIYAFMHYNLEGTGTNSIIEKHLNVTLGNNPIREIDPQYLKYVYGLKNAHFNFITTTSNYTTCIPQSAPTNLISPSNWIQANALLTTCYNNFVLRSLSIACGSTPSATLPTTRCPIFK